MPRETKMERLERENRDLTERLASAMAWGEGLARENGRIRARIEYLYETATTIGAELIRERLRGPEKRVSG